MPFGLSSEDLKNLFWIERYAAANAEHWYRYINNVRGRNAKNGDLRVVIGIDKTTGWGMATFSNLAAQKDSFELKFRPVEPSRIYEWEYSGMAETRAGPHRRDIEALKKGDPEQRTEFENQCLFVRTLNIRLQDNIWKKLESELGELEVPGAPGYTTYSDSTRTMQAPTNSFSGFPTQSSAPMESNNQSRHFSTALTGHPSGYVNEMLLKVHPNARIAIIEDQDWMSVIKEDDPVLPPADEIYSQIFDTFHVREEEGIVFLEKKEAFRPLREPVAAQIPLMSTNPETEGHLDLDTDEPLKEYVEGETSTESKGPSTRIPLNVMENRDEHLLRSSSSITISNTFSVHDPTGPLASLVAERSSAVEISGSTLPRSRSWVDRLQDAGKVGNPVLPLLGPGKALTLSKEIDDENKFIFNSLQNESSHPRMSRRKPPTRRRAGSHLPPRHPQEDHDIALASIRSFLKGHTCYDSLPVSCRLIVLDTKLNVKKALQCILLNGVVSAPLWSSEKSTFAGMLTMLDIIHLIQYYSGSYMFAAADVENFRLESLRDIENELRVAPPPLIHAHPSGSLYEAARLLIHSHARRIPLLDNDTETGHEVIVSILTQYRLLKFISINCHKEIQHLQTSLRKLKIGTYVAHSPQDVANDDNPYYPIATVTLNTPVFDVVHVFSDRSISAVPIINEESIVLNLYETLDVIALVQLGKYQSLGLTISEALKQRSHNFQGVIICTASDSLGTVLQLIKTRRVHRVVVVEGEEEEKRGGKKGRLLGIITLSDALRYIIGKVVVGEDAVSEGESMPPI